MGKSETVEGLDAITMIVNDHRIVDQLFEEYEQAGDADVKLRLVAKMIEELTVHAWVEERELYPLIEEKLPNGKDLTAEALQEHQEARDVLAELERTQVSDKAFDERVRELIDDVRHHVEEEERDLLPPLRDKLSEGDLRDLAMRIKQAKSKAPVSPSLEERGGGNGASAEASKSELYEQAKEMSVEGRSRMSKEELAEELRKRQ